MCTAIDQFGQVIDVYVSTRRDADAAHRFFQQAIGSTSVRPVEVTTDRAPVYPAVLEAMLPAAWHCTDRYANNGIERPWDCWRLHCLEGKMEPWQTAEEPTRPSGGIRPSCGSGRSAWSWRPSSRPAPAPG